VPDRDRVAEALRAAGIGVGIHYPVPVHLSGAYARLGHRRGSFPVVESAADELLSLPMFPHLTSAQQERVADELTRVVT
jgi:dTDP-4-amino-4,6-dideoxygalactose transaminase